MTKPHEEQWTLKRGTAGARPQIVDAEGNVIATVHMPRKTVGQFSVAQDDVAMENAKKMAAAPDMARALLAGGEVVGEEWHTRACWDRGRASCDEVCTTQRAALRKATVLP